MNWRNRYGAIDFKALCDIEDRGPLGIVPGHHANGTLKLPNGLIYTGDFEDFTPDGYGRLTNGNTGEVLYDGYWHRGHAMHIGTLGAGATGWQSIEEYLRLSGVRRIYGGWCVL